MNVIQTNDAKIKYFEWERPEILPYLPFKMQTMLDVGCGAGNFGRLIKSRNKDTTVWGIEIDKAASIKAAEVFDKVIYGDALENIESLPDNFFDCIVFNDSLEHMVDPYSCLEKIKAKLTQGGVIVASIPNVRYYTNLYELLFKKDWRYEDSGILDRTHLRFFTKKSMKNMFRQAGYKVDKIEGINSCHKLGISFLGYITLGALSDIKFLQFVVVTKKT